MADEKSQDSSGTVGGWAKAAATSVVGLVAGAFLMYLTPLVNTVIKPAKPVSNFAVQASGLTAEFSNRSSGGVQGWWDFGDGTALEPFDPKVESVKHIYAKPGTYNVKLALANLLGEESDRSAPVTVEAGSPQASGPTIELFDLTPQDKRELAPAVYKLKTRANNANYCILCCDNKSMEIIDASPGQDRLSYISFEETGAYTIRLAAVNGKQLVEQSKTVYVGANDSTAPMAKLLVMYEAVRVDRLNKNARVYCGWQADTKAASSPFRKDWPAEPGFSILGIELVNKDDKNPSVRNVRYEIAADKSKVTLTGELVRPTGLLAPKATPPHWVAELKLAQERRSPPQTFDRGSVSMAVSLNSTVKIPMQPMEPGYEVVRKEVTLQLWDGPRKAWEGKSGVSNAPVRINNQACQVTAIPQADGYLVSIAPMGPIIQTGGFSLFPKKGS